nr:T9SS type A sorting domain-containing protein [Bacteroidia bacterium]
YTISLLDIQGRVVYTKAFESEVGLNHIEMNVSEYQKGIYFGYLTSATEKRSIKVIID